MSVEDVANVPSFSSFNVTASGAIELRDIGAERNKDAKKEWRHYWIDDTTVDHCPGCNSFFRVHTRKHHCRLCGGVFCSLCSQNKTPLHCLEYPEPVRVCDCCFRIICFRSLSHSPSLETQISAIQGLEQYLQKRINNRQVVNHAIPALIVLGTSKSQIILLYIASAVHQISEDFDNHPMLAEYGIADVIEHIINFSVQQGRFLGSLLPEREADSSLEESFINCRKTLLLAMKSLCALSSNQDMKQQLSSEGKLETFVKLCFAHEIVFTESIHDLLLRSVLELSLHDKICSELFSLERGLELPLSLAIIENDDEMQITALTVLLMLARQDGDKRRAIIERGALGVACKLLSEDAKGPQRRTSMQLLEELVVEDISHDPLMLQYDIVPTLVNFLFVKQGLKEKNQKMIAKTLGLLGNKKEYQKMIIEEIDKILGETSHSVSELETQQGLRSLSNLAASEWLRKKLCQSKIVREFAEGATLELTSSLLDWMKQ